MLIEENNTNNEDIKIADESVPEKIYAIIRKIPKGRITSYNAIARYLMESSISSRQVGEALKNYNGNYGSIPVHRVVHRKGLISGIYYLGSLEHKQKQLQEDGIETSDNKVLHFYKLYWDPCKRIN